MDAFDWYKMNFNKKLPLNSHRETCRKNISYAWIPFFEIFSFFSRPFAIVRVEPVTRRKKNNKKKINKNSRILQQCISSFTEVLIVD